MNKEKSKYNKVEDLDPVFKYNPNYQYTIRKDDKINISVWAQDELSVGSVYGIYNSNEVYGKWLLVDANGNIEVPKIGSLNIKGKTIIEVKEILIAYYAEWLVTPVVDVKVLNKEVSIIGEVIESTTVLLEKDNNTLIEVLTKSKGFDFYANLKKVQIIRQIGNSTHTAYIDLKSSDNYLSKNIQIIAGDVVVVPTKKYKNFDKRISLIIPFTGVITTLEILYGTLKK
jgi:polysaccharide export outer membrane protein